MAVSVDYPSLEDVVRFQGFLKLLMNPDQFADMAKQLADNVSQLKVYVEAKTKLDDVDQYVKRAEQDIDQKYQDVEKAANSLKDQQIKFDLNRADVEAALLSKEDKVRSLEQQVSFDAQKVTSRQKDLDTKTDNLSKQMSDTLLRAAQLDVLEKTLNEKATKLKELLG